MMNPNAGRALVSPSILSADFSRLGEELRTIAAADWIHVDVMDGRFVPNITIGPLIVAAARRCTPMPLDVHLMIVEPEKYIGEFRAAGPITSSCMPRRPITWIAPSRPSGKWGPARGCR